jgi:peptidoglycan/xylan/chitin deacetylase (PgdA/CDA1 family)
VRKAKVAFLEAAKAASLFEVARTQTRRDVRILCYHGVWMGNGVFKGDSMFILPSTFERRLDRLRELRYPVVTLHEATVALREGLPLPDCATVITIDDGWYSTAAYMVPALVSRSMPATVYCDTANLLAGTPIWHVMAAYLPLIAGNASLEVEAQERLRHATNLTTSVVIRERATRELGDLLGVDVQALVENRAFSYMTSDELKHMYEGGVVDVQLHTHSHSLHDLSRDAVDRELEQNVRVLGEVLGISDSHFRHFCYPSGVSSVQAERALAAREVLGSTTTSPGLASIRGNMQAIPRFLDGDNVSPIEFEAELSGFMPLVRRFFGV